MILAFSGLSSILHLAHHFDSFRRSLRKSFAANCTFLLAVHHQQTGILSFVCGEALVSHQIKQWTQNRTLWYPCNGVDFVGKETIHVDLNNSAN